MGDDKRQPIFVGAAVILLLVACGIPAPTSTPTPPPPTPTLTSTPTPIPPTATATQTPTAVPPTATQTPVQETGRGQVGEQGGEIAGTGGARLIVPAGALAEQVEIHIAEVPAIPEVPAEYAASPAGPAYEVTVPTGTELQAMADLVLPLQRQAGADESRYTVFRWDGAAWSDVGGFVEGDFIRVQVSEFSIYCPVYGPLALRPLKFENNGPRDARVRVWTYKPASPDRAPAAPGGSWVCRAPGPPLAVDRAVCRMLPLGSYSFCVEYRVDGEWRHHILNWRGGLGDHAPNDCALADKINFWTDVAKTDPGRCGEALAATPTVVVTPTLTAGPTPTPAPIQTEGVGVIITLKPGHRSHLPADGKSQTVLLVDVVPGAYCWGGQNILVGHLQAVPEASLGAVSYPDQGTAADFPVEIVYTAGTTAGEDVITVRVSYCTELGVMVYGVCTDAGSEDWRCEGKAKIVLQ
jgi:hypothetical protein